MGYSVENEAMNTIKEDPEEENQEGDSEAKKRFEEMKERFMEENKLAHIGSKPKYTKDDANAMINKMKETNQILSAHKVDFTKPLETDDVQEQNIEFDVDCHSCGLLGKMRMCTCTIPYFKEIIIMAFTCDACGNRNCEVKVGGGIPEKGARYTVSVKERSGMDRDVFKSETAEIIIPEIGVTVVSGSLGGVYSTIEGLLEKVIFYFLNKIQIKIQF